MTAVRFIHTSDIHLDTSFSSSRFPSWLGRRKREAIRATFRRILEDAQREGVDLILIAGDLFEHDRVTPDTVAYLRRQFESLQGIPVFISPGNHDPFLSGSPYCEEAWPPNVHIFKEEVFRSVELPELGVRVTGFGYNETRLVRRLFSDLPPLTSDLLNIVLAHGSDTSHVPEGKIQHGPLGIEEITGKNIQYCALGHYHQQRALSGGDDGTVAWYCGIPEGRNWSEEGQGGYLLGEIRNRRVELRSVPCCRYPLRTIEIDCEGYSTREQVVDSILKLQGSAFDADTILRIRLTGSVEASLDPAFTEMSERLAEAAVFLQWEDQTTAALDFESYEKENTLRGRFLRDLSERIATANPVERTVLERARLYGLQALMGREVRLR